jgi:hypothetical protein
MGLQKNVQIVHFRLGIDAVVLEVLYKYGYELFLHTRLLFIYENDSYQLYPLRHCVIHMTTYEKLYN